MPVICVSGQPACGTSTVAKLLAEKLGISYFSPGHYFKSFSEKKETEAAVSLWKTKKGSSKGFHQDIDKMQQEIADKGNVVIDGKLSIKMVKNADLRVWLKANFETRAERVAKRDSINLEKASKELKEKESLERESWKKMYGFDYFDQEGEADLVIDVSNLTPEQIVEKILQNL